MKSTHSTSPEHTPDWRHKADCRKPGLDPELWFPAGTSGPHLVQIAEAKAFCRDCPVAMACAVWAVRKDFRDGVFGGLTTGQRRRLTRKTVSDNLTDQEITELVKAVWARDARDLLVDAYLARTIQGDQGHVWWRGSKTSITVAGATITPAQLAFVVGHGRAPEGHVKATCGTPYCVAAEHLADGRMRWQRDHQRANAA